jgi:hypothetical protein
MPDNERKNNKTFMISFIDIFHHKLGSGSYSFDDVGNVTHHVVRGLSRDERYMFPVTAYDKTGAESIQSNVVRWGSRPSDPGTSDSGGRCLIAAGRTGSKE